MASGWAPQEYTNEGGSEGVGNSAQLRRKAEEFVDKGDTVTRGVGAEPHEARPDKAEISNVSAIGSRVRVEAVIDVVRDEPHLVAYSGVAIEAKDLAWLDVHHSDASKGGAVITLKEMLGADRVVCFGDSDNDVSMFELADESYAPANAKSHVKDRATEIIGHHDEDGIARFLRERFDL